MQARAGSEDVPEALVASRADAVGVGFAGAFEGDKHAKPGGSGWSIWQCIFCVLRQSFGR